MDASAGSGPADLEPDPESQAAVAHTRRLLGQHRPRRRLFSPGASESDTIPSTISSAGAKLDGDRHQATRRVAFNLKFKCPGHVTAMDSESNLKFKFAATHVKRWQPFRQGPSRSVSSTSGRCTYRDSDSGYDPRQGQSGARARAGAARYTPE